MEESLMEVVPRLEKRTHYLATFANLATLLGLLGTVMGLINAFAAVATVNPAEKANLLSASISVAMNCTAFGLMTAVPLLFIHALLQTKTTELIDSLEMASVKFLNAVTERSRRRGGLNASRCMSSAGLKDRMRRSYQFRKLERHSRKPAELLLVPMIDIFTVLVTFLLMTAVFSRTVILELKLPPANASSGAAAGAAAGGDRAQGPAAGRRPQHRTAARRCPTPPQRLRLRRADGVSEAGEGEISRRRPRPPSCSRRTPPTTPWCRSWTGCACSRQRAASTLMQAELFPDISIGDAPHGCPGARQRRAGSGAHHEHVQPRPAHAAAPDAPPGRRRAEPDPADRHPLRDGVVPAGVLDRGRGDAEQPRASRSRSRSRSRAEADRGGDAHQDELFVQGELIDQRRRDPRRHRSASSHRCARR